MTEQQENENMSEVYAVHIRQENPMFSIMNINFIRLVAECEAVIVAYSKEPVRYLASFVLPDRERQKMFTKELQKKNITYDADKEPSFVKYEYIKDIDLPGWEELRKVIGYECKN